MRPISSGGTIWRLLAQRSRTACMCAVFHAITMLASRLGASATACISSDRRAWAGPTRPGVDRAFERVRLLAPVEHPAQFPAKAGVDEMVRQERRSQQLSQMYSALADGVTPCRRQADPAAPAWRQPRDKSAGSGAGRSRPFRSRKRFNLHHADELRRHSDIAATCQIAYRCWQHSASRRRPPKPGRAAGQPAVAAHGGRRFEQSGDCHMRPEALRWV